MFNIHETKVVSTRPLPRKAAFLGEVGGDSISYLR